MGSYLSSCFMLFVFVELVYQTSVAQMFKLCIISFVIAFVVFARAQEANVLL